MPQPLTVKNSVGNGVPATADLVTVQNGLFAAVVELGNEMGRRFERLEDNVGKQLQTNREEYRADHEVLQAQIKQGQQAQANACALLMAPYSSLGQAFKVAGWIVAHKGWATGIFGAVLTATLIAAAILGGMLIPGR